MHTVLAHPTNPEILYIGAVNGGVWKTTDATATNPTWAPQTDYQASLSMGAMAFDPADDSWNTLVAGIGNYSSFANVGGSLTGILRTTDGGANWYNPGSTGLSGKRISGIAARGNTIVVTLNTGGLYRSSDGGVNFVGVQAADFTTSHRFTDLAEDTSDPARQRIYAAVEDRGVYRSDDFGATWAKITGPGINAEMHALLTNTSNDNIRLTVHPATGRLYADILIGGQARGIFYANDGTAASPSWTRMDVPVPPRGVANPIQSVSGNSVSPIVITAPSHGMTTGESVVINGASGNTNANGLFWITVINADSFRLDGSTGSGDWSGGGTWTRVMGCVSYSIVVDPENEDLIYVAGGQGPSSIGDNTSGGVVFRGNAALPRDPTVVPSPQWDHLTHDIVAMDPAGGTAHGTAPHADGRDMAFAADGVLIEVDDGGVFKQTAPQNNTGDWYSLAGNLGVVEYHDIAYDTVSNVLLGGTQDNGTQVQQAPESPVWTLLSGRRWGRRVRRPCLTGRQPSFRPLQQFPISWRFSKVDVGRKQHPRELQLSQPDGNQRSRVRRFVRHAGGDQRGESGRILFGGSNGIYESLDQGTTMAAMATGVSVTDLTGNVLDYGCLAGVPNEDVAYAGTSTGKVYVRTLAGSAFAVGSPSGTSAIRGLRMDPDEWHTAFAINSSSIFATFDAGGTWSTITGNLGELGAAGFNAIEFVSGATDAVVLGTNLGVYASLASSLGTWFRLGSGLAHAPVWDLDYDPLDDVLVAGTMGRGAWKLDQVSQQLLSSLPAVTVTVAPTSVVEDGPSNLAFTFARTGGAGGSLTVDFAVGGDATFDSDYTVSGADEFAPRLGQ